MIKRIHHVGIVVKSIDEAFPLYTGVLGLEVTLDTVVEEQGVRAALLKLGDSELELLEPVREQTGVPATGLRSLPSSITSASKPTTSRTTSSASSRTALI